jgi:hypothetical protein
MGRSSSSSPGKKLTMAAAVASTLSPTGAYQVGAGLPRAEQGRSSSTHTMMHNVDLKELLEWTGIAANVGNLLLNLAQSYNIYGDANTIKRRFDEEVGIKLDKEMTLEGLKDHLKSRGVVIEDEEGKDGK